MFDVSVNVSPEFESHLSVRWVTKVVERVLSSEFDRESGLLIVVVSDDSAVRQLNKVYRGLDESTDVLSFSSMYRGRYYGEDSRGHDSDYSQRFVLPPGVSEPIGEVVISYTKVLSQAESAGHSADRELELLLTHGVLHLLGHDHEDPGESIRMTEAQDRVLGMALLE